MKNYFFSIVLASLIIAPAMQAFASEQPQRKTARASAIKSKAHKAQTADANMSAAQLGKKYFESENYALAVKYVKKAAAEGDLDSQVRLADMTFFGNAVDLDQDAALEMIESAIAKGSAYAIERKAFYTICQGDKAGGFELMKKASEAGNQDASVYVMNCYRTGDFEICTPDSVQAAKYCKLAADQGSMEGKAFYGLYLLKGDAGVQEDAATGMKMIEEAYSMSQRNSFEKNCPEAAMVLSKYFKEQGQSAKANAIATATKKYHTELR